ncbi:hypothetical protein V6N12_076479 [Hibiscus sabdariffa]|uniref:Uncharacterized protein n=1 Tax=Hibiscus sabdariffa TaxID=183260 RepID=A0ABR2D9W3_9ROSI
MRLKLSLTQPFQLKLIFNLKQMNRRDSVTEEDPAPFSPADNVLRDNTMVLDVNTSLVENTNFSSLNESMSDKKKEKKEGVTS